MILYNGKLVKKQDVNISYEDRGYYFGDGVYEVFRIYEGRLFHKKAHYDRLERSAASIQLKLPYTVNEIDQMLEELMAYDNIQEGILYLQTTRGTAPRAHTFPDNVTPSLLGYCKEVKRPFQAMKTGIKAITMDDIRWQRCDIKSLNLLPNTMAKQHAVSQGVEEAILHRNGTVTECSASNLMIVRQGEIYTHPANNYILHGITREIVLKLARDMGIKVIEQSFQLDELYTSDEAFITGTTVEVTPVISIDQKMTGSGSPGKVTKQLQEAFEQQLSQ